MSNHSENITVTQVLDASAERVYDAFLDPSMAGMFMFATPGGEMLRAEVDPRVGGAFRFTERRAQFDADHVGTFLDLIRPDRIVFDFAAGKVGQVRPIRTRVEIRIKPLPSGCELTLTHPLDPEFAAFRDRTIHGWQTILNGLADALAADHGKPG